jgi:hypothetical protein
MRMNVDAIVEEESEESEKTTESAEHEDESKPTDRKLFKCPSSELADLPTSAPSPSYTWRIDLTKTEQVTLSFQPLSFLFLKIHSCP